MEVKIGIQHVQREITVDTDDSAAAVEAALAQALESGGVLTMSDARGRKVLIPVSGIAYLDLGQEHTRPVGFGAV